MKHVFTLAHSEARRRAIQAVQAAPDGYVVTVADKTRTGDQNALLWALLTDVSDQVDWYGNKLSQEEWKHVFTAALQKQKVVPGLDGGFVVLGQSTSRMTKSEFGELIELIRAFGVEHYVEWNE